MNGDRSKLAVCASGLMSKRAVARAKVMKINYAITVCRHLDTIPSGSVTDVSIKNL